MAEAAEAEVAQSDALFTAPVRSQPVQFIGPEAAGPSPEHSAPAAVVARHASAGYGNASTARLVARLRIQRKAVVSTPGDPFEREAEAVATSVTSGGSTPAISSASGGVATVARETAYEEPKKKPAEESGEPVQRAGGGDVSASVSDAADAAISSPGPGTPMHPATRGTLESRLGTDLGDVRIHDDATAHHQAAAVEARAFTHGNDIWLGSGESQSDLSLMAHETAHVVQQRGGSAVQRAPLVQRLIPDFILERINDYARHVPGWTLFTVILGFNPLTGDAVPRTPINLLEGFFGLVPFGTLIFDTLREHGIIDAAFAWVEGELGRLDLSLNRIERTISAAWDDVRLLEGFDYNMNVLRRHFGALYDDVVRFANSLVDQILRMIKEAVVGVAESLLAENRAWALIKKILGYDPLRDVSVTATPTEILEDFLILIGKQQHLDQMRERGTVEETANWLATQIATFMSLLGELRGLIGRAWDAIQPANLANLMNDMRALATDAGAFLQRVWDFASTVAVKVLELIKNALLAWLSSFAHEVPGFHLVTVIIGRNPFTGEEVPRTAQNIIRGFISLLPGGNEIYARLEETGVVTGAAARIEGAMESLGISWAFIVGLFTGLWNSLSIEDLLTPIDTFMRIVDRFGEPISRLVQFVGVVLREFIYLILQLMNFPFDLIGSIVTNAMTAIEDIKRDPIGFLQHMLDAIKLGFSNFFDNIVTHLLGGLADWLFRGLRGAGIEPPTDLTFASVLDFVLNVLGISMERIWEKLGNRIGQETVARIRGVIDRLVGIWSFIKDVQERGVVAIWEYIEGQLSNLWNMVLQKAQEFIMERIIARAIQWLLSLLDVTGIMPVINAVMGFFNAVQSAIEYLRDILAIINDWVTTIAAVARGEIQPGAQKMEQGLANAIPVAIGFLANQFGLGNIGEKIGEIVEGLRGLVDQALDWLIDRAVSAMESLMASLGFGGGEDGEAEEEIWWTTTEPFEDAADQDHTFSFSGEGGSATLVMHSDSEQRVAQYLMQRLADADATGRPPIEAAIAAHATYLIAQQALEAKRAEVDALPADQKEPHRPELRTRYDAFKDALRALGVAFEAVPAEPLVAMPLVLPSVKPAAVYQTYVSSRELAHSRNRPERDTDQRGKWDNYVEGGLSSEWIHWAMNLPEDFRLSHDRILRPNWTPNHNADVPMQVDHVVEWQVRPLESSGWVDQEPNFELLDAASNQSSGSEIRGNIEKLRTDTATVTGDQTWIHRDITFTTVTGGGSAGIRWPLEHIIDGKHLEVYAEMHDLDKPGATGRADVGSLPGGPEAETTEGVVGAQSALRTLENQHPADASSLRLLVELRGRGETWDNVRTTLGVSAGKLSQLRGLVNEAGLNT
jgi:hypothetical protein